MGGARMPKKPPFAPETLSRDVQKFFDVLSDGPDLAAVLVAGSFLDECLGSLLRRRLVATDVADKMIDPFHGALGTFARRIDAAYCLGLLRRGRRDDLKTTAKIRNHFAHSHLEASFGQADVMSLTDKLTYCDMFRATGMFVQIPNPTRSQLRTDARGRFVLTASLLSQDLLVAAHSVQQLTEPGGRKKSA
jgi:hypothetical protein